MVTAPLTAPSAAASSLASHAAGTAFVPQLTTAPRAAPNVRLPRSVASGVTTKAAALAENASVRAVLATSDVPTTLPVIFTATEDGKRACARVPVSEDVARVAF